MIHSSPYWKNYFETNLTHHRIDWNVPPCLTNEERSNILYSLKAWQLGETSDGVHLMAAAQKYAGRIEDPVYPGAVALFIKEEQKHGSNLGRYVDLIGEQRAQKDWGDTLFRKVRYFNTSMELWTITVIIVESAAQLFYQALHDATQCTLLKSICSDIITDEKRHIKFQNERLYIIFSRKNFYLRPLALTLYYALFFAVIHAVWWGHKKAFKAGGLTRKIFMQQMHLKFFTCMQFIHNVHREECIAEPSFV